MTEQNEISATVSLAIELNIGGQVLTIKSLEVAEAIKDQLDQGIQAFNEAQAKIQS